VSDENLCPTPHIQRGEECFRTTDCTDADNHTQRRKFSKTNKKASTNTSKLAIVKKDAKQKN